MTVIIFSTIVLLILSLTLLIVLLRRRFEPEFKSYSRTRRKESLKKRAAKLWFFN